MKLLALEAVRRMAALLMDRAEARGEPVDFWLKDQPGDVLTGLWGQLTWTPLNKAVELGVVWRHPIGAP